MDFKSIIKKGQKATAYRIALTGVEKVGKSTFAAGAPNPLFLCSETGLIGKQFEGIDNIPIGSWSFVRDVVKGLIKDNQGFKTIAIDTVDWLEDKLVSHILTSGNKKTLNDFGFGGGQILVADEWKSLLADLEQLWLKDVNIIFLSHCHVKSFENPLGDNFDRYEMKTSKKVGALTREWVDAVLFAKSEVFTEKKTNASKAKAIGSGLRVIHTAPSPAWEAGNRYSLPPQIDLSWAAFDEAVKAAHGSNIADALYTEIAEIIAGITADEMAEEKIAGAKIALERDKGKADALRLLKNKLNEALNNK